MFKKHKLTNNVGNKKNSRYLIHYTYDRFFSNEFYCIDEQEVLICCDELINKYSIKKESIIVMDTLIKIMVVDHPKMKINRYETYMLSDFINGVLNKNNDNK